MLVSVFEATYFVALLIPAPSFFVLRPIGCEDLKRFPPNNRSKGGTHLLRHDRAKKIIKVRNGPATQRKVTTGIFGGPTRPCITPSSVKKMRTIIFLIESILPEGTHQVLENKSEIWSHLADRAEMADTISFPCFFSFHFCPAARTNGFLINIQMFS